MRVRVRFAPSPTGALHLGGIRTALFNYLFAKKHKGDFLLRIEDTDQSRYVEGAEEYINESLKWCGLYPNESPVVGGAYGPYRQSERKDIYVRYAERLVKEGHAYYSFDTTEELEAQRKKNPNFTYGHKHRMKMRNSLSLPPEEVKRLLDNNTPKVIRIHMPVNEQISFTDMIRGEVTFHTNLCDDKVLLKADGMPTYHLAVVVDDYLMKISHVFRGEEWLPSSPIHILLWQYLGWQSDMPQWAHLPLILKPDGNGKLSKRDGERLGFPVYATGWTDPQTHVYSPGFRELGFLPEAFLNLLTMLGWNDGSEQEIFSKDELIERFSIERISHAGAKFDFEKAKWFNAEWIKRIDIAELRSHVSALIKEKNVEAIDETYLDRVIFLVKDRCTLISDFWEQALFFFKRPVDYDISAIESKWDASKAAFFHELTYTLTSSANWNTTDIENEFKTLMREKSLKPGTLMLPFRVMLVGGEFGPPVFEIAELLGKDETIQRMTHLLNIISSSSSKELDMKVNESK